MEPLQITSNRPSCRKAFNVVATSGYSWISSKIRSVSFSIKWKDGLTSVIFFITVSTSYPSATIELYFFSRAKYISHSNSFRSQNVKSILFFLSAVHLLQLKSYAPGLLSIVLGIGLFFFLNTYRIPPSIWSLSHKMSHFNCMFHILWTNIFSIPTFYALNSHKKTPSEFLRRVLLFGINPVRMALMLSDVLS